MTSLIKKHLKEYSEEELKKEFGSFGNNFVSSGRYGVKISDSLRCVHSSDVELLCCIYETIMQKWTGSQGDISIGVGAWITTIRQALLCVVVSAVGMKKKGFRYLGYTHNNQNPYGFVVCDETKTHCVQFQSKLFEGKDRLTGVRLKAKIKEEFLNISYGSILFRKDDVKDAYVELMKGALVVQTGDEISKKIAKKAFGKVCASPSCLNEAPKICSRCKTVSYCSQDCARQNWKHHKKHCCPPLPKGVSVTLSEYENYYKETLTDMKGNKKNFKLPIPALAYFDQLTGDMFSVNNLKKKVKEWRKVKIYKESISGIERELNVEEELNSIDVACEWFHKHFAKKATLLGIPESFSDKYYK